ncbi:hypothetical protein ccbrp13_19850 [Ktedonobacteria bacterium brp13]|nr:hypothetical protein ccbrp13_19850 [Ktedonobacteria bacterium brp13]
MGIVVVGIMWLVRIMSTQFGAPMITYPGNAVGGQALFGGTYFFFPYVVIFAALIIGMSGANSVDLPQANIIID